MGRGARNRVDFFVDLVTGIVNLIYLGVRMLKYLPVFFQGERRLWVHLFVG
jgi:hypothetical protein